MSDFEVQGVGPVRFVFPWYVLRQGNQVALDIHQGTTFLPVFTQVDLAQTHVRDRHPDYSVWPIGGPGECEDVLRDLRAVPVHMVLFDYPTDKTCILLEQVIAQLGTMEKEKRLTEEFIQVVTVSRDGIRNERTRARLAFPCFVPLVNSNPVLGKVEHDGCLFLFNSPEECDTFVSSLGQQGNRMVVRNRTELRELLTRTRMDTALQADPLTHVIVDASNRGDELPRKVEMDDLLRQIGA